MNRLRFLLIAATLAACATASAQQPSQPRPATQPARPATQPARPATQPAQPQLTPEQRAQLAKQDAEMSQAALRVMQLVDANRAGEVWDGSSAVMKQAVPKDAFVRQITTDRARLGAVSGRASPVVTRTQGRAGTPVPAGLYINVQSSTKFAAQQQPIRELVSFRLDDDKVWRVSGYTLR